MIKITSTRVSD